MSRLKAQDLHAGVASSAMSTMDMDLILVEILPKLPDKSLTRFKCVCKAFRAAILSMNLLIIPGHRRIICYDLNNLALPGPIATFTWDEDCSVTLIGSSSGLLCLSNYSHINNFSILNPFTRICKHIPIPVHFAYGLNAGFAFDHVNFDYKIVTVSDKHNESAIKTRITRVYSLNTNSWSENTSLPTDSIEKREGGALVHNHLLHWMFWSPSMRKRRIGCFDVCQNSWVDDIILPSYYYDPTQKNYLLDFGVFEDRLFSSFENQVDDSFDVWLMERYGIQDSWVKHLTIPVSKDFGGGLLPIASRGGSDEILIRQRHTSRLFWYSKTDGEFSKAIFRGSPGFWNRQLYTCSRSLIDLPGGELFGDSHQFPGEIRQVL